MTITVWRVLCVASAVLFLAGLIILLVTRPLKNKYYHVYTQDELVNKNKMSNGKNSVYFASGEARNYISKYAVCRTEFDKYFVCKFVRKFTYIKYFVLEYSAHGRVVNVQQIEENDTGLNSRIVTLSRSCATVNVVIGTVDGTEINTDVIRPASKTRIRLYALIKSFTLFALLFAVRHMAIEIFCRGMVGFYMRDMLNYISIGVSFAIALLSYAVTVLCYRGKIVIAMNGGTVEYEFV